MTLPLLGVRILGTGAALPDRVVTTEEMAAEIGVDPGWATSRTGVLRRHRISGDETAVTLGAAAVRDALDDAGLDLADVDVLLNASGTQAQPIPDGAALLAQELALDGITAYSVHGTCLSSLAALQHAGAMVATGQARHVVVVATESTGPGLNPRQRESALLFGDGAASFVVAPADREGQGIVAHRWETHPVGAHTTQVRAGGTLVPPFTAEPDAYRFDMSGLEVLKLAHRLTPAFLEALRPGLSTGLPGIARVIPHQASRAGLELMGRIWPVDRLEVTLPGVGNMVGASIPHALHTAHRAGRLHPGDEVLLAGTGAGLTLAGTVLRW